MISISVRNDRLLRKLKSKNLVKPSASRVIIDINADEEWVQLYICENHRADNSIAMEAVNLIESLFGVHGEAPTKIKDKKAKKDKE